MGVTICRSERKFAPLSSGHSPSVLTLNLSLAQCIPLRVPHLNYISPSPPMNFLSPKNINDISKNYNLNIFCSNIQSYNKNMDEFHLTLSSLQFPEIVFLNEIRRPVTSLLNIDKYQPPLTKIRNHNTGGGIALWVKSGIRIIKTDNLSHLNLKCVEALSAYIEIKNKRFTIIGLYRAPNKNIKQTLIEFHRIFEHFDKFNSTLIYTGDTNINLLDISRPITTHYNDILGQFCLEQLNNTVPTRITHKSASLIDHAFTNKTHDTLINVLDICLADHQAIFISSYIKTTSDHYQKSPEKLTIKLTESIEAIQQNINWDNLTNDIQKLDANDGLKLLIDALDENIITKKAKNKNKKPNKPWFTREAADIRSKLLISRRKFLKKQSKTLESAYKTLKSHYAKLIKRLKEEYYHKKISLAQNDGKKIWQTINECLNRNNCSPENISLKNKNGILCSDPTEVANIFNDFYINFAPELAKTIPKSDISPAEMILNAPKPDQTFSFRDVTEEEILQIINNLAPKSSSGFDFISNNLTKGIAKFISLPLRIIINKSLNEKTFPSCIKIAKIAALYKSGCKNTVSNFRPISQLSSMSKIIEKISLSQTENHMNKILSDQQFGFRKNHSTIYPLMLTMDYIQLQLNKKHIVTLIGVDLRKCFDVINAKELLPAKLEHYKYDKKSIDWIISFFTGRRQFVQINNKNSDTKNLRDISVCQGSSMGPNYFNVFFNDIVYNTKFTTFLFADDSNFLLSNDNFDTLELNANKEFKKVQNYINSNQLSLNLEKTKFMIFYPKNVKKPNKKFDLKADDHHFEETDELKFLGIPIQNDLKFIKHYENVVKKMKSGIAALNLVKRQLPIKTKLQIYNALIKPHYEYCCLIWFPSLTQTQLSKIISLQKQALRLIYLVNRLSHSNPLFLKSNIVRFDLLFKKNVIEIFHKKHLGLLPKLLKDKIENIESSKNNRTSNLKIPHVYKKGDMFYELINTYNNLPHHIKDPPTNLFSSKKRIKSFIQTEYKQCHLKNCKSCEVMKN